MDSRTNVDPVAGVEPHAINGEAAEGMIQGLHTYFGPPPAILDGQVGARNVIREQPRIVDLQNQPGLLRASRQPGFMGMALARWWGLQCMSFGLTMDMCPLAL